MPATFCYKDGVTGQADAWPVSFFPCGTGPLAGPGICLAPVTFAGRESCLAENDRSRDQNDRSV
jgi:hypothetical protein